MSAERGHSPKWKTTLSHCLRGRPHRFEAEQFGDHSLHSTVASLNLMFGIAMEREWVSVPNRFGGKTRVRRYWVSEDQRPLAARVLAGTAPRIKPKCELAESAEGV